MLHVKMISIEKVLLSHSISELRVIYVFYISFFYYVCVFVLVRVALVAQAISVHIAPNYDLNIL